jgi:ATP-dependent protease ClpP protease subunit
MSQPSQLQQPSARYVLPVIEERTSYGFKRLDPYTKLFEERIIFLGQAIDDTVANDIMAQLLTLESMDPDRDRWFTADEAKDYGMVDKVAASAGQVTGSGGTA